MKSIGSWVAQGKFWTGPAPDGPQAATLQRRPNAYEGQLVLVVDDDPTQRVLARDALETNGFVVEEAENGPEGVAKAYARHPSLIILDIIMPVLDGFTVTTALRRNPATADVPILIATGVNDPEAIQRGFDIGATDFIVKPISWETLALRVKYILRNHAAVMEARAAMEGLEASR